MPVWMHVCMHACTSENQVKVNQHAGYSDACIDWFCKQPGS